MKNIGLPEKIIIASSNPHKIEEIGCIFAGVKLISMADAGFSGEIEENGATFAENALIKARTVSENLSCDIPVLADDSGLCVDALDGAPGIYSARFSGGGSAQNRALLLEKMQGITERGAHFCCAVCLYFPDGTYIGGEGKTYGHILTCERGQNGFGYDSLFYSDDLKMSFGEADEESKNAVSHRFRALKDLRSKL